MSTEYRPIPDISFDYLFDGRLEKYGVREQIPPYSTERRRYLEGRDGVLEAHQQDGGTCNFTCRGMPWAVFDALTEEFEIDLVSEHDHRYWGFSTEEEWVAFQEKIAKKNEDAFYSDLLRYLRDEPNDLKPGTNGMTMAEIAKTLVANDPGLMAHEKRDALLEAVNVIYYREHAVTVTLTEQDLALAEMMVARTGDLPEA